MSNPDRLIPLLFWSLLFGAIGAGCQYEKYGYEPQKLVGGVVAGVIVTIVLCILAGLPED